MVYDLMEAYQEQIEPEIQMLRFVALCVYNSNYNIANFVILTDGGEIEFTSVVILSLCSIFSERLVGDFDFIF